MNKAGDYVKKMSEKDITIAEIIKAMYKHDITVAEISEEVKTQFCDNYCKFPEQYEIEDNDNNYSEMLQDCCNHCVFNII